MKLGGTAARCRAPRAASNLRRGVAQPGRAIARLQRGRDQLQWRQHHRSGACIWWPAAPAATSSRPWRSTAPRMTRRSRCPACRRCRRTRCWRICCSAEGVGKLGAAGGRRHRRRPGDPDRRRRRHRRSAGQGAAGAGTGSAGGRQRRQRQSRHWRPAATSRPASISAPSRVRPAGSAGQRPGRHRQGAEAGGNDRHRRELRGRARPARRTGPASG